MTTKRVSEFGRKWDVRVPRYEISRYMARQHVATPIAETEAELTARMEGRADFTPGLRRQTLEYVRICHERNRELFRKVMGG